MGRLISCRRRFLHLLAHLTTKKILDQEIENCHQHRSDNLPEGRRIRLYWSHSGLGGLLTIRLYSSSEFPDQYHDLPRHRLVPDLFPEPFQETIRVFDILNRMEHASQWDTN